MVSLTLVSTKPFTGCFPTEDMEKRIANIKDLPSVASTPSAQLFGYWEMRVMLEKLIDRRNIRLGVKVRADEPVYLLLCIPNDGFNRAPSFRSLLYLSENIP